MTEYLYSFISLHAADDVLLVEGVESDDGVVTVVCGVLCDGSTQATISIVTPCGG